MGEWIQKIAKWAAEKEPVPPTASVPEMSSADLDRIRSGQEQADAKARARLEAEQDALPLSGHLQQSFIKLEKERDALRAENERLRAYLTEMASDRPSYFKDRGCSDGNCVIYKPEGMHTNGGCQCGTKHDRRGWGHTKLAWFKQQALAALEPK